jgi:hypothetical protein
VFGQVGDLLDAGRGEAHQDATDDVDLLLVVEGRGVTDQATDVVTGFGVGDQSDEHVAGVPLLAKSAIG